MELSGAIAFTRGNHLISSIIAWVTKSKYSHTLIVLPQLLNYQLILEASKHGVAIAPLSKYKNNKVLDIYIINLPKFLKDKALEDLIPLNEAKYGFMQGFFLGIIHILNRFGFNIKTNIVKKGIICSELVAIYLKKLGMISFTIDMNLLSPEDIHAAILKISKEDNTLKIFEKIDSKLLTEL